LGIIYILINELHTSLLAKKTTKRLQELTLKGTVTVTSEPSIKHSHRQFSVENTTRKKRSRGKKWGHRQLEHNKFLKSDRCNSITVSLLLMFFWSMYGILFQHDDPS
jgi:hypothetical protein